jgi:hypothetical protein
VTGTNELHGAGPLLRNRQFCIYSRTSQYCVEPEGTLSCSREPSIGPYPEPDQPVLSPRSISLSSTHLKQKQAVWPESASELYRPSDCRLSAKFVQTFADRGCHVVSVTDPYGRILGLLDRDTFSSQLYSRG